MTNATRTDALIATCRNLTGDIKNRVVTVADAAEGLPKSWLFIACRAFDYTPNSRAKRDDIIIELAVAASITV